MWPLAKIGIGAVLLAASGLQVFTPARAFEAPLERVYGLAVAPVTVLGVCAAVFNVGVILLSEGICDALDRPSLSRLVIEDPWIAVRLFASGALAGLVLEVIAQWLGRLWYYPYWTAWFYGLILVPGFAFYWLSVVESYLAAKAVLDSLARPLAGSVSLRPLGLLILTLSVTLSLLWYAHRGGFTFAITSPAAVAPSFAYPVLAVAGVALLSRPLVTALVRGYWVPFAAIVLAAAVVSVAMEVPNAMHRHWAYAHFPGPAGPSGLPWAVFAAWPLQYLVFLTVPGLFGRTLSDLFWRPVDRPRTRLRPQKIELLK